MGGERLARKETVHKPCDLLLLVCMCVCVFSFWGFFKMYVYNPTICFKCTAIWLLVQYAVAMVGVLNS